MKKNYRNYADELLIQTQYKRIKDLEAINEEHKKINGDLRDTINKAISYIDSMTVFSFNEEVKHLFEILGKDNKKNYTEKSTEPNIDYLTASYNAYPDEDLYEMTRQKINEIIKTLTIRCDLCGIYDETTQYRLDPYKYEVHDECVYKHICDNCYEQLKEDI